MTCMVLIITKCHCTVMHKKYVHGRQIREEDPSPCLLTKLPWQKETERQDGRLTAISGTRSMG